MFDRALTRRRRSTGEMPADPQLVAQAAAERAAAQRWAVLERCIREHRAFQYTTFDGVYWIDPFNGSLVMAPFDRETAIRDHFAKCDHWHDGKLLDERVLRGVRWRHYLVENLATDGRFRRFDDHGRWVDPWSGEICPRIRLEMVRTPVKFRAAVAAQLAKHHDADPRLLPDHGINTHTRTTEVRCRTLSQGRTRSGITLEPETGVTRRTVRRSFSELDPWGDDTRCIDDRADGTGPITASQRAVATATSETGLVGTAAIGTAPLAAEGVSQERTRPAPDLHQLAFAGFADLMRAVRELSPWSPAELLPCFQVGGDGMTKLPVVPAVVLDEQGRRLLQVANGRIALTAGRVRVRVEDLKADSNTTERIARKTRNHFLGKVADGLAGRPIEAALDFRPAAGSGDFVHLATLDPHRVLALLGRVSGSGDDAVAAVTMTQVLRMIVADAVEDLATLVLRLDRERKALLPAAARIVLQAVVLHAGARPTAEAVACGCGPVGHARAGLAKGATIGASGASLGPDAVSPTTDAVPIDAGSTLVLAIDDEGSVGPLLTKVFAGRVQDAATVLASALDIDRTDGRSALVLRVAAQR